VQEAYIHHSTFSGDLETGPDDIDLTVISADSISVQIWSLARSVRSLSMIDCVFVMLNAMLFHPGFLCLLWGPYFGYSAGRHYNQKHAAVYAIYYVLKLVGE
jgi:hypothetical protein